MKTKHTLLAFVACGPVSVIPGTCTADANRNGEVEIDDLLTTLQEWGPCP